MTENIDENSEIIATLNCPFCDAVIVEIVKIVHNEDEDCQDESENSDGIHQYGLPFCNHVAFFGFWRGHTEIITENWHNEMMILTKDLGAEFVESEADSVSKWRHNSPISVIANTLYSNNYIKKDDYYEKLQDIINRLFPDHESIVLNKQFYKNYYRMIFMNKMANTFIGNDCKNKG